MMDWATLADAAGRRLVAGVDRAAGRYWPAADLVPGFSGDMVDWITALSLPGAPGPAPRGAGRSLAEMRLCAPVDRPRRNIFCVGKNYLAHVTEFAGSGYDSSAHRGEAAPPAPIFFTKATGTVIGPGEEIPLHPQVTTQVDYEAELAVIIGRGGRGISRARALEHVFGYTIVNDVSARDLQKRHSQWFLGKSLDGFCPMGPVIVRPENPDPSAWTIRCHVNGALRQQASIGQMIFDVPTLIEVLSAGMTLQPGDVIATGTPAGVGLGLKPPAFLAPGDRVVIEIDGIGVLENPVGRPDED
ncbi:MAG: fumarylacetoacetate hydrolase family protein [Halothiobacillaceae bacterium]